MIPTTTSRKALGAAFALLFTVIFFDTSPLSAAPKAELWEKWQAHDPNARTAIDHSLWDQFLAAYVEAGADGVNTLRYGEVTAADRQKLAAHIHGLITTRVSRFARATQMAYWINLYNALTVKVVLDHYPVATILDIDISPGLFSNGPWGKKLVTIEGEQLSLDDIVHRILRPIWKDPRIHYVVNCASIGCPNLATRAFTAARLEEMLDAAARDYVNHPRGVAHADKRIIGSKLFDWYRSDFGANDRGVIEHLRWFAAPELSRRLASASRIDSYRYDWALNDTATSPVKKMDMEDQRQSR